MLLSEKLANYSLILASKSPRREMLLRGMDLPFTIEVREVEETYPKTLPLREVPLFLARKKAEPFLKTLKENELVLTCDTVVIRENDLLGKPQNMEDAVRILKKLASHTHEVVSGVCLTSIAGQKTATVCSKVTFGKLSEEEIRYYLKKYQPFDKAGAYGIQEWIGYVGIEKIDGSYSNIVGLPTAVVYRLLEEVL